MPKRGPHTTFQTRADRIAGRIGKPDTHHILVRILDLIEGGEVGESIVKRLNGPPQLVEKPKGWFVGD